MPARKLGPERAALIKADYEELSQWNGAIQRVDGDGAEVVIGSMEELARHHGISKSSLFNLKNRDWIVRGSAVTNGGSNPSEHDAEMLRDVIGELTDRHIERAVTDRARIDELERELVEAR